MKTRARAREFLFAFHAVNSVKMTHNAAENIARTTITPCDTFQLFFKKTIDKSKTVLS